MMLIKITRNRDFKMHTINILERDSYPLLFTASLAVMCSLVTNFSPMQ